MIKTFFYEVLYRPLFNLLIYLYQNYSALDLGIAIILLTIIIRLILYPIFSKMARDQVIMQKIAPKIQELQVKHKDDKQTQAQEMMKIYREHNVNPFSSFFYLLVIQLPVLITLYRIFIGAVKTGVPQGVLYSFVNFSGNLNTHFLGKIDLTKSSIILVILAAIFQYIQAKLTESKSKKSFKNLSPQERMAKQMTFIGPILTIVILVNLPGALALYWLVSNIFSVFQQILINKKLQKTGLRELAEEGK